MKTCLYLLFTLCLIWCTACHSPTQTYHDDGSLHEEYAVDDQGAKHGSYVRYSATGSLFEKASYEHGQLQGPRTIYYPSGEVQIQEVYADNLLDGIYRSYYPGGVLELEVMYYDNVMKDTLRTYYPEGTVKEVVMMADNEENGPFVEYYPNGQPHWKGTFRNGDNEVGLLEEYNMEGLLVKKMMCDDRSVCQTIWTLEDGDITPEPLSKLIN